MDGMRFFHREGFVQSLAEETFKLHLPRAPWGIPVS